MVGRELALDGRLARLLYGGRDYRGWLGLMLFDPRMLSLYAARVSGSEVLADRKLALLGALGRHVLYGRRRAGRCSALAAQRAAQPRWRSEPPDSVAGDADAA